MDKFTGKVWVLGDDIDTDIIIPTEYLALKTIDDMKQYGFSPLRPELAGQIQKGDIIVAGKNFGCGSSREQAPEIIKALGIQCVIAKSFARIFFRNSINNGFHRRSLRYSHKPGSMVCRIRLLPRPDGHFCHCQPAHARSQRTSVLRSAPYHL